MNETNNAKPDPAISEAAEHYFQQVYGLGFENILAPIEGINEADGNTGSDLRGSVFFRQIEDARRADDPNLPLGPWERELKKADWPLVGKACIKALAVKSKDLQLAAWAVEAGIQRHGFAALMPGMTLLMELCDHYWEGMYPSIQDEDLEFRTNLIRWIDQKMPNLLALCPLTDASGDDGCLNLGDWRRANLPTEEGKNNQTQQDAFLAVLASTTTPFLIELDSQIQASRAVISQFDEHLDELCGDDSPGFNGLTRVLNDIEALTGGELANRGQNLPPEPTAPEESDEQFGHENPPVSLPMGHTLQQREEAYAMLAQAADFLMHADPHSPAPYLVRQAIAWGRMDTRALYQQLFLEQGGQINVFELLGLDAQKEDAA